MGILDLGNEDTKFISMHVIIHRTSNPMRLRKILCVLNNIYVLRLKRDERDFLS
jgi:hypothetical protein